MSQDEDMLVCPYNRSHVVSKLRMARHLVKCQANHPHVFFATCFYDFLHRVPPEELDEHLKNCPSKNQFPVRFCTEEDSDTDDDPQIQKIFITKKAMESAKTPEWRKVGGMTPHSSSTKNKGGVSKSSTQSHASLGGSTATSSTGEKKESTNAPFYLRYSASEQKSKKSSEPKEESWDTESSDEEQPGPSTSSTPLQKYSYKDDSGSMSTDGSSSFKGDDNIDAEGFIKVRTKNKSKRRNK